MRYVVFDIETQNLFQDVGKNDPVLLDISVVCAYDSGTDTYHSATIDDLHTLWPVFEHAEALVGYNSNHFDIPLLNKYYPGDLTIIPSIDILESIRESLGRRIRLDSVAEATLGKKKSGHGLQAIDWWKAGEIEKIKKYCLRDVEITKDVFEYARTHGMVKYRDGTKTREIPLNTEKWIFEKQGAMTHTLPF